MYLYVYSKISLHFDIIIFIVSSSITDERAFVPYGNSLNSKLTTKPLSPFNAFFNSSNLVINGNVVLRRFFAYIIIVLFSISPSGC